MFGLYACGGLLLKSIAAIPSVSALKQKAGNYNTKNIVQAASINMLHTSSLQGEV